MRAEDDAYLQCGVRSAARAHTRRMRNLYLIVAQPSSVSIVANKFKGHGHACVRFPSVSHPLPHPLFVYVSFYLMSAIFTRVDIQFANLAKVLPAFAFDTLQQCLPYALQAIFMNRALICTSTPTATPSAHPASCSLPRQISFEYVIILFDFNLVSCLRRRLD